MPLRCADVSADCLAGRYRFDVASRRRATRFDIYDALFDAG